ncbi:MAG: hypothetical protein J6T54_12545 [Fibrobacter sp.]|nr:hypothetical protein [Fibrobacter sp.]
MDLYDIKRGLRAEIKKRENEQYSTFQCNVRQMCKDVLSKLEEQESEIAELNNRIAPKQSDKTLQERLNEVCEKHGVSTLQDLDWALCESEKRRTRDCIEAANEINHQKYKRCLAMARLCEERSSRYDVLQEKHDLDWSKEIEFYYRWYMRWLELAEKFKEAK